MRRRLSLCVLLALTPVFAAAACAPAASLPTSRPETKAPTRVPSATASATPVASRSPTAPAEPQLVRQAALGTLPDLGHSPVAAAALGGRVYVANRASNNVSVLEGMRVVHVIAVGAAPAAIAADEDSGLVYVANEEDGSITIISGNQTVRTVPAPDSPACLAAFGGRLYVGARDENAIAVLDGFSGQRIAAIELKASIGALAMAINPATRLLYASVYKSVQIVDLDSLKVVAELPRDVYVTLGVDAVGGGFYTGEYDAEANIHYLIHYTTYAEKEIGRAAVGGDPRGLAVDPQSGRIYVANSFSNDISVLDGKDMMVVSSVPVGLRPVAVAIGAGGEVYAVNTDSDNVSVLDPDNNRMVGVVPLAMLPRGMAVDPRTGDLYVACASSNSVFVLRGNQMVSEIPAGLHPVDVALSPDGERLFVLNYVSGDLTLIPLDDTRAARSFAIGRWPEALAVEAESGELYAGDLVLDLSSLRLHRRTELRDVYRLAVPPVEIQFDPRARRAYMVASNGVPGSNGGLVIYVVDLKTGDQLEGQRGGLSTTGMAIDPTAERVFSTAGRFGYYELIVNDTTSLKPVSVLSLPKYPAALAYNAQTHHLFVLLTYTSVPSVAAGIEMWVLDSRGLGTVGRIAFPGRAEPGDRYDAVVDEQRGYVYLSDTRRGVVHILRDVTLPVPPSPTPTDTPTPWPTWTPSPAASPTTAVAADRACQLGPGPRFEPYWSGDPSLRQALGCPAARTQSGSAAEQPFERGSMIWREADRTIFVLYDDGAWRSYADYWQEGMPDYSCEAGPPGGMVQPKRGFGLVWCTEHGVKEGLGWALEDERGYMGEWQAYERGEMITSGVQAVIYALLGDGSLLEYPAR